MDPVIVKVDQEKRAKLQSIAKKAATVHNLVNALVQEESRATRVAVEVLLEECLNEFREAKA